MVENLLAPLGNQMDDAVKFYKKAIELNPNQPEYHFRLGLVYGSKGMNDDAILCYEKAKSLNLDEPRYHYSLGLAYDAKGVHDKAMESLRKAMELQQFTPEIEP